MPPTTTSPVLVNGAYHSHRGVNATSGSAVGGTTSPAPSSATPARAVAPASSRSRSAVASAVGEGVQLEPVARVGAGGAGADADRAQPEQPVHDGRGQVDGPHPVERGRQPLPVEEPALELDPAVRDPVARRQVAHDTDRDRDRERGDADDGTRAALGGAEEEHADQRDDEPAQLGHGVDQQHPAVEPLPVRWS